MGAPPSKHRERLAAWDAASLEAALVGEGASLGAAKKAVGLTLRRALFDEQPSAPGGARVSERELVALGAGARVAERLAALSPEPTLELVSEAPSRDDTLRLALRTDDGALIESVLIPGPSRTTLCISSQAGCARACAFCETGRHGLAGQLSSAEIVDQVRLARAVHARGGRPPLTNLVLMGMGEPFDNLGEVLRALSLLTDPRALGLAPAHVTVSTVGVADKLEAFFSGTKARLAVSLHAPDDARRARLMPVNRRFPLDVLLAELRRTAPPGHKILFEYVLFDGLNDGLDDAEALARLLSGLRARVNVIPANPGPAPELRAPPAERVDAFVARLSELGVTTLVRRPKGRDVGGACGQLAGALREGGEVVLRRRPRAR
jgi:23S rRNA (adenine2503-C2)-methyltransferase